MHARAESAMEGWSCAQHCAPFRDILAYWAPYYWLRTSPLQQERAKPPRPPSQRPPARVSRSRPRQPHQHRAGSVLSSCARRLAYQCSRTCRAAQSPSRAPSRLRFPGPGHHRARCRQHRAAARDPALRPPWTLPRIVPSNRPARRCSDNSTIWTTGCAPATRHARQHGSGNAGAISRRGCARPGADARGASGWPSLRQIG